MAEKRIGDTQDMESQQLKKIWYELQQQWFSERTNLLCYQISWSVRPQKRTLAVCYNRQQKVIVARELNYTQHSVWLKPLLYHEMCHAVLEDNVSRDGRGKAWHGREFKALEARHPLTPLFKAWIAAGGWQRAIRSDRSKRAAAKRAELSEC